MKQQQGLGQFNNAATLNAQLVEEQQNRNELFAGAGPNNGFPSTSQGGAPGEPTVDQLVKQAQNEHKATTQTAQRALKTLEQTKQVQAATLNELDTQNKAIDRINNKLHAMNQELTYSEKLLRYMRRWCCCFICDSCTGADPEGKRRKEWEKRVDKGKTVKEDNAYHAKVKNAKQTVATSQGGARNTTSQGGNTEGSAPDAPRYRDPDIRLTEDHKATEMALHDETRVQNQILDQIHEGLGDLLNGAKKIGDELAGQSKQVDELGNRTENTKGRIDDMNNKSQLKEFRIKKKGDKK